jgi:hypothetical protein
MLDAYYEALACKSLVAICDFETPWDLEEYNPPL